MHWLEKVQAMNEHWKLPPAQTAGEMAASKEPPLIDRRPLTLKEMELGMEGLELRVERLETTVEALRQTTAALLTVTAELKAQLSSQEDGRGAEMSSTELAVEAAQYELSLAGMAVELVKTLCSDNHLHKEAEAFLALLFKRQSQDYS